MIERHDASSPAVEDQSAIPNSPDPEVSRQSEIEQSPTGGLCPVVGVGASAGGLDAFTKMLDHLPATTGMGFVIIQHLDPNHESILADLLAAHTRCPSSRLLKTRKSSRTMFM